MPLQESHLAATMSSTELLSAMRVWDGKVLRSGGQALLWMLSLPWFMRPLRWLEVLPPLSFFAKWGYNWLARNRHCFNGQCSVPSPKPDLAQRIN